MIICVDIKYFWSWTVLCRYTVQLKTFQLLCLSRRGPPRNKSVLHLCQDCGNRHFPQMLYPNLFCVGLDAIKLQIKYSLTLIFISMPTSEQIKRSIRHFYYRNMQMKEMFVCLYVCIYMWCSVFRNLRSNEKCVQSGEKKNMGQKSPEL